MKTLLTLLVLTAAMMASGSAEAAQCKVQLKNGNGKTLDIFNSYGYDRQDACRQAKKDCKRVIRAGYHRARVLNCVVVKPIQRRVTKSCNSTLIDRRGRTIQRFLATATGVQGSGVKAKACKKAQKQCQKSQHRNGGYGTRCISQSGGVSQPAPRPVPRRPMPRRTIILDA